MVPEAYLFREKGRKKRDKYTDLLPRIGGEDKVPGACFSCYCLFLRVIPLHAFAQELQRITH